MEGVGELFGESVDDVVRRPRPVVVPLLLDLVTFGFAAALLTLVLQSPSLVADPRGVGAFQFGIPRGLPSLGDVLAPLAPAALVEEEGLLAATAALFLALPLAAYLEGGFIRALSELRDPESRAFTGSGFHDNALRHFWPLLALRGLLLALTLAAAALGARIEGLRDTDVVVLVVSFLLIFAPYVVVLERTGPFRAIRRSAQLFADFPATCLAMLLFLLLTTAAALAFVGPAINLVGLPGGIAFGIVLYAPVGTVLSLFVLRVYRALNPAEEMPEAAPTGVVQETARPKEAKWGVEGQPRREAREGGAHRP